MIESESLAAWTAILGMSCGIAVLLVAGYVVYDYQAQTVEFERVTGQPATIWDEIARDIPTAYRPPKMPSSRPGNP